MQKSLFDFLTVSVAKVLNGGLAVVFNVLLLRHFGPEQFGIFSLCVVFIQLVDGVLGSSLDMGVIKHAKYQQNQLGFGSLDQIEVATLLCKTLLSLFAVGVLCLGAQPIGLFFFHSTDLGALVWLTAIGALGLLFLRSFQAHCQLHGRFLLYGVFDIVCSVLRYGGIAIVLYWLSPRLDWVMLPYATAPFCVAALGLLLIIAKSPQCFSGPLRLILDLFSKVKWIVASFVVTASVSRLDVFLLQHFAGMEALGIFSGGMILASIPELLGSYAAVVFNPKVKTYINERRFLPVLRRFQLGCLLIAAVVMAGAYFGIDRFGPLILPEKFSRSADVLLMLLPGSLMTMALFPLTLPYVIFFRPRFFFLLDIIMLPFVAVIYVRAIESYGAIGAAAVTAGFKVIKGIITQTVAWDLAVKNERLLVT